MDDKILNAINLAGGTKCLSEKLGLRHSTVIQWAKKIRPVPLSQAVEIEKITNGDVRCEDLTPSSRPVVEYLRKSGKQN